MASSEIFSSPSSRRYEGNSWIPERDHRTKSWFLVASPTGLLIVSAAYWYFVKVAGPRYMAGRKPFSLTRLLLAYNAVASVLSAYFGWQFIKLAVLRLRLPYLSRRGPKPARMHPRDSTPLLVLSVVQGVRDERHGVLCAQEEDRPGRKPFSLTRLLLAYNAVASALSAYFGWQFIKLSYWDCGYHILQDVDLSQRRCTLEILRLSWWYLLFRVYEMSDTVFFVLRKKTAQVSGLHVFHHLVIPWDMWLNINYALQPMSTFSIVLNCFIHVIMYTYYFVAALGARYQKFLWWKKYLTALQIAQFTADLLACLCVFCTTGDYLKFFVYIGTTQFAIFFAWFSSFYINVYKR
ncbi:hypothetical protein MTO96_001877 [Rhipicephalus appendiculatus]